MSRAEDDLPAKILALEKELRAHSDSDWNFGRLMGAYIDAKLDAHPRRIELILEFISRFPRSRTARCAYVHVEPMEAPEAFESIEALWSRLRTDDATDPELAMGHAALVAGGDRQRAATILREALTHHPEHAELWTELGRIEPDPSEQLLALHKARALGSTQPNLLAWTGRAAAAAKRMDEVHRVGSELMARIETTRNTVSCPIDWEATGRQGWNRIQTALEHDPERRTLVNKLSYYANDKHWAHTFLGLAAAEHGKWDEASDHLLTSAQVWSEPRVSSYGPSFVLAQKHSEAGRWDVVTQYLTACKQLWNPEILDEWLQVIEQRQIPDFDDR